MFTVPSEVGEPDPGGPSSVHHSLRSRWVQCSLFRQRQVGRPVFTIPSEAGEYSVYHSFSGAGVGGGVGVGGVIVFAVPPESDVQMVTFTICLSIRHQPSKTHVAVLFRTFHNQSK